ncbi:hypothetical protein ACFLQY_04695 [Verrucomicrobiota bacterium]
MKKKILLSIAELLSLTVLMLSVPIIIGIDSLVIGHGTSETSITELMQEALILLSAVLCGISAWKRPQSRGFLALAAGFFGCMFIRECDAFFDKIAHGFWVYPAITFALATTLYALTSRETVIPTLLAYLGKSHFTYISIGLLLILVFSRAFGSGHLWEGVMGANYRSAYKSMIQEGLELLGYVHVAYGAVLLFFYEKMSTGKEQATES